MSALNLLQELNKKCCQSESFLGIEMGTNDNHQWYVYIDLFDTEYETKDFKSVDMHIDKDNWVNCIKENYVFKGFGGAQNLEDILHIFCNWANN